MKPVAMTRRACIMLLGGAAVAWPCAVIAQTPAKVYRIGLLSGGAALDINSFTPVRMLADCVGR